MKTLRYVLVALISLSLTAQTAFAIDKCKVVKAMDKRLETEKESLNMIKKINHEI